MGVTVKHSPSAVGLRALIVSSLTLFNARWKSGVMPLSACHNYGRPSSLHRQQCITCHRYLPDHCFTGDTVCRACNNKKNKRRPRRRAAAAGDLHAEVITRRGRTHVWRRCMWDTTVQYRSWNMWHLSGECSRATRGNKLSTYDIVSEWVSSFLTAHQHN